MVIIFIFIAHWYSSLFFQTVFLHRYASHQMFTMSKSWEKVFFFLTFLTQGSSFLNPRAYAILHRLHHKHSDTEKDPHSPIFSKNIIKMNLDTVKHYEAVRLNKKDYSKYDFDVPRWPLLEKIGDHWITRITFMGLYTVLYVEFATATWQYALLPIHFVMGPLHGSIVNWCGHRYGYTNDRKTRDNSKNTLPIDILMMGELFQNNHHSRQKNIKFSKRWFEVDPGYAITKFLSKIKILRIKNA
jgi:stearoyl-CoA desaturase (delta-9 desaturase)